MNANIAENRYQIINFAINSIIFAATNFRHILKMKNYYILLFLLFFGIIESTFSQEVLYKAGLHSFFDNNEFKGCEIGTSQTMAGVHAVPQIGLSLDTTHRIFVGVDAMHEFGRDKIIGYLSPIAYYEFSGEHFRFYMGAFPRSPLLDKYPRFFFQDSILNYRPTMTGLFWEYSSKKGGYMNVWLDWTSRQTDTNREAFFMGWSGRYNRNIVYGQHFGYMYHFAGVKDPAIYAPLHDNGRMWTALGIDLSSKTPFEKLDINVGLAIGLERNRESNNGRWYCPQGLLSQVKIEYRGLGLFNTYYRGDSQGKFHNQYGSRLYWNDPLYRATSYNRLDGYLYFVKSGLVTLKFIYSLHFVERGVFHEQQFYATFDMDNLNRKKSDKKYRHLWDN